MASVTAALRLVKDDLGQHLNELLIEGLCEQIGYSWRKRLLGPVVTVWMLIEQVLSGNVPCAAVRHLCGVQVSASAYCQARKRLPLGLLKKLMHAVCETGSTTGDGRGLWRGHRTYRIDGTGFSMPDTPQLARRFGYPGNTPPGCGFPVGKLLTMFDAATGWIVDVRVLARAHQEIARIAAVLEHLGDGDVLVGDRGFCSYTHLAMLRARGAHGLFRMNGKKAVDFTPGRAPIRRSIWVQGLGVDDQVVRWTKPRVRPNWISPEDYAALPASLEVRETRYAIHEPGFRTRRVTLVTTLLDAEAYPAQELAQLYRRRWQIETDFRHLKVTMGMDVLRCKSFDGVLKELYAFVIAYNLVRRVILQAATAQGVEHDRISFIDALRWLRSASPGDQPGRLIVNPLRPGRFEPRVKKRWKNYPSMRKPRHELRLAILHKQHAT